MENRVIGRVFRIQTVCARGGRTKLITDSGLLAGPHVSVQTVSNTFAPSPRVVPTTSDILNNMGFITRLNLHRYFK